MTENNDAALISNHGLGRQQVEEQLMRFRTGFPYLEVVRPASVGDGIERLDDERLAALGRRYEQECASSRIVKFVPASGAATRMFKDLYEYLSSGRLNGTTEEVLSSLGRFAFSGSLMRTLPAVPAPELVIDHIVNPSGLGYGNTPKALILFHRYPNEVRTALEEHLTEGAEYAACGGRVAIHFTVSPEHRAGFDALLAAALPRYAERFGVEYDVEMSVQKSSTDTIAVNPDNTPFRNADGSLLFRPAGHGALIENLNDLDADIVFIKNIDNVTTDSRRGDTIIYKKALAGLLLTLRDEIFAFMRKLDGEPLDAAELGNIATFVRDTLRIELPEGFDRAGEDRKAAMLRRILDRPIRVCGMVRNEGEPGGGPFFVRGKDGMVSLQIAESSQIAPDKRELIRDSTHFNPVDLVCSVRDYRGEKYDLRKYVDSDAGFISEKSKDGRPLRAQELPGLWNGAMSDWNTIFVEVPITTFTPVKVVTDLLRPVHQN